MIFYYCIVSLSSYAAEDYSSTASAQSTPIPPLNIALAQRTRSNSIPLSSPKLIKLSPITVSPRKKWVQEHSFGIEPSLLFAVVDNAAKKAFEEEQEDCTDIQASPSAPTEMEEKKKNSLSNYTLEELITTQESLEEEIDEISIEIDTITDKAYKNIKILSDSDSAQEAKDNAIASGKTFREQLRKLNKKRDKLRDALSVVKDEKEKYE